MSRNLTNRMTLLARPLGYVENKPVIKPIGDRDLFLGNILSADPATHDQSFGDVLSLTTDEQPLTTHHHPLDDGPDNEWRDFEQAVQAARQLYRADGSLLIHCNAGISRSSTLIALLLAVEEGRTFGGALDVVHRYRPMAMPHPALQKLAVIYLAANGHDLG